jgi:hypothetical protein
MTDIYVSQFWRLRNPRSRHQQIQGLVRAYLQERAIFLLYLTWQKG